MPRLYVFCNFWVVILMLLCQTRVTLVNGSNQPELGGTFLALSGQNCVVLAADSRVNVAGSNIFLGQFHRKILKIGRKTLIGCYGLDGDMNSLVNKVRNKLATARVTNSQATPELVSSVISNTLYENNLMAIPIVAGMSPSTGRPRLCSMDALGALSFSDTYLAVGTSAPALLTNCERLYSPELQPSQLVAVAKNCLKLALARDSLSGGSIRILTLLGDGRIYECTEDFNTV
jgi:20S proteasome alpha/beta subunit